MKTLVLVLLLIGAGLSGVSFCSGCFGVVRERSDGKAGKTVAVGEGKLRDYLPTDQRRGPPREGRSCGAED